MGTAEGPSAGDAAGAAAAPGHRTGAVHAEPHAEPPGGSSHHTAERPSPDAGSEAEAAAAPPPRGCARGGSGDTGAGGADPAAPEETERSGAEVRRQGTAERLASEDAEEVELRECINDPRRPLPVWVSGATQVPCAGQQRDDDDVELDHILGEVFSERHKGYEYEDGDSVDAILDGLLGPAFGASPSDQDAPRGDLGDLGSPSTDDDDRLLQRLVAGEQAGSARSVSPLAGDSPSPPLPPQQSAAASPEPRPPQPPADKPAPQSPPPAPPPKPPEPPKRKGGLGGLFGKKDKKEKKGAADDRLRKAMPLPAAIPLGDDLDGTSFALERELLQAVISDLDQDQAAERRGGNSADDEVERALQEAELAAAEREGGTAQSASARASRIGKILRQDHKATASLAQELTQYHSLSGHGPMCIAYTASGQPLPGRNERVAFAVGMTNGAVRTFAESGQALVMNTMENSPCTCVAILDTGHHVVSGHVNGKVVICDIASRQSQVRVVNSEDFPKPLHNVLFLGGKGHIAAMDSAGNARVFWTRSSESTRWRAAPFGSPEQGLLDMQHVLVKPADVLDERFLRELVSKDPVVAIATASRSHVFIHAARLCPQASTLNLEQIFHEKHLGVLDNTAREDDEAKRQRRGSKGALRQAPGVRARQKEQRKAAEDAAERARKERSDALPALSWLCGEAVASCLSGSGIEKGAEDPQLAVLWWDVLQVFRVQAAKLCSDDTQQWQLYKGDGVRAFPQIVLPQGFDAVVFLAPRAVIVVDEKGGVAVVDPRVALERPHEDNPVVEAEGIDLAEVTSVATPHKKKSIRQAVKGSDGRVFLLQKSGADGKRVRISRIEVLPWQTRLGALAPSHATLLLARDLKLDRAKAAVGLPRSQQRRDEEVGRCIARLLDDHIRLRLEQAPPEMTAAEEEHWWRELGEFLFEYLCDAGLPNLLFSVVYEYFIKADMVGSTWAPLLEANILRGKVRGLPSLFVEVMCEWVLRGALLVYYRDAATTFPSKASCEVNFVGMHSLNEWTCEVSARAATVPTQERCVLSCAEPSPPAGFELMATAAGRWAVRVGTGEPEREVLDGPRHAPVAKDKWAQLLAFYRAGDREDSDGICELYVDGDQVGAMTTKYRANQSFPVCVGAAVRPRDSGGGVLEKYAEWQGDVRRLRVYSGRCPLFRPLAKDAELWDHRLDCSTAVQDMEVLPAFPREALGAARAESGSDSESDEPERRKVMDLFSEPPLARLERILMALDPAAHAAAGGPGSCGDFSEVFNVAERMCLYHALATCRNKYPGGEVVSYTSPIERLYAKAVKPVRLSLVEWKLTALEDFKRSGLAGLQGTVQQIGDDGKAEVKWESGGVTNQTVDPCMLRVLPGSRPNAAAAVALLEYLQCLLRGTTFAGARIPMPKTLPQVRKDALDFLFQTEQPQQAAERSPRREQPLEATEFPRLEHLLRFDCGALVRALEGVWFDETRHSPWRKVVDKDSGELVKIQGGAEDRFKYTRDQVVRVINAKTGLLDLGPLQCEEAAARGWPPFADLVTWLKLLARSIAAGCVDVSKFERDDKTGYEFVKRIFAHLSYACPAADMAVRAERQQVLEEMMQAALRPRPPGALYQYRGEDRLAPFIRAATEAGFMKLQVFLYKQEHRYKEVLSTYIYAQAQSTVLQREEVFDFLDNCLTGMRESAHVDQEIRDAIAALQKAIIDNLRELVLIDSHRTAELIFRHLPSEQNQVLRALNEFPETQFEYMESLVIAANAAERGDGEEHSSGQLLQLPASLRDWGELYIRRLCEFRPAQLHDFLRANEGVVDFERGLELVLSKQKQARAQGNEESLTDNAVVYLCSRNGEYAKALDILSRGLRARIKALRARVVDLCISCCAEMVMDRQGSDLGLHNSTSHLMSVNFLVGQQHASVRRQSLGRGRSRRRRRGSEGGERLFSEAASGSQIALATILLGDDGRRVKELIEGGISLCRDSMKGGTTDVTEQWFILLDKFVQPKKVLAEVAAESVDWASAETVAVAAAAVVARALRLDPGLPTMPPPPEPTPEEREALAAQVFDELDEVVRREREAEQENSRRAGGQQLGMGRLGRRSNKEAKQKPRLRGSMPPQLRVANACMLDIYGHYISTILMRMLDANQGEQLNVEETRERSRLRKQVCEARRQVLQHGRGQGEEGDRLQRYQQAKAELARHLKRMESVVLHKISAKHADSAFGEFKDVLVAILENSRFERNLQSAFHECFGADIHLLEKRILRSRKGTVTRRAQFATAAVQKGVLQCSGCRSRLVDSKDSRVFQCGHVFHGECMRDEGGCMICRGGKGKDAKGEAEADPPQQKQSPVAGQSRRAQKALNRALDRLTYRVTCSRKEDLLMLMCSANEGAELAFNFGRPLRCAPEAGENASNPVYPWAAPDPEEGEVEERKPDELDPLPHHEQELPFDDTDFADILQDATEAVSCTRYDPWLSAYKSRFAAARPKQPVYHFRLRVEQEQRAQTDAE